MHPAKDKIQISGGGGQRSVRGLNYNKSWRRTEDNQSTNWSFISTFLHQAEKLLSGAVVTVLFIKLFHGGQQFINNGL